MKFGNYYSEEATDFYLWSPAHKDIYVILYKEWDSEHGKKYKMIKDINGFHNIAISGDLDGYYYMYLVNGEEVTDPYAKASSINSKRSAIINMEDTNPEGFMEHSIPKNPSKDAIIYEAHIKDFTYDKSSKVNNRGKYLGFVEDNKHELFTTGIDHLKELGITHVHLLPIYDFDSVDEDPEVFLNNDSYNWGYDPEAYNIPEGSYATNPYNPKNRIYELKEMVMKLHDAGISVVMDVVYNHTSKSETSNLHRINPFYYHRSFDNIHFSNGSGCGNEIASEREIVRQSIIDSIKYWQEEYKIDGFRFDLMALTDKETMRMIKEVISEVNENSIIYGEPWTAQGSPLSYDNMITTGKQKDLGIGIFNSNFRDAIKGESDDGRRGYLQGNTYLKKDVQEGISGSIGMVKGYAICNSPQESINYFNSHDNLIIIDKLKRTLGNINQIKDLSVLATNIIMTSQGIPFIHAGNEFLRDKKGIKNSYNSTNCINAIDWNYKYLHNDEYIQTRNIINFRKEYSSYFAMNKKEIFKNLKFIENLPEDIIGYTIKGSKGTIAIFHSIKWMNYPLNLKDLLNLDQFEIIFSKCEDTTFTDTHLSLDGISTTIIKF